MASCARCLKPDGWLALKTDDAPYAQHMREALAATPSLKPWPEADRSLAASDTVLVVVQVNGKVRSKIELDADASEEAIREAAMADPKVREHLEGKAVRKVVYVPRKLVSIVAG